MDMPDDSGISKRERLLQVIENSPDGSDIQESAIDQLEEAPEIPFYIEHVWEWFWKLNRGRTYGFSSPNPLSWESIKGWSDLTGTQIRPIEVEILFEIDSVYLKYTADRQKKESKTKKGK
jgi:hypothetical protein